MHSKQQLNQFKRIRRHYEMELEALTAELQKLKLRMSQQKSEFEQLESEMQNAQRPHGESFSIVDCVASAARMKLVSGKRNTKFQEYSRAKTEFEEQRSRVQQQLSRIESMNQLIKKKSKLIDVEKLKREQLIADERYLQHAEDAQLLNQHATIPRNE